MRLHASSEAGRFAARPMTKAAFEALRRAVRQALAFLLGAQNKAAAWRYIANGGDNDMSVTAWALYALDSCRKAGERIPAIGIRDATDWIASTTIDSNGRVGYSHKGTGKVFVPQVNESYNHHETMTAAGLLCRSTWAPLYLKAADLDKGVKLVMADPPDAQGWSRDYYYWHHATRFIKQCAPKSWETWKAAALRALDSSRESTTGCCRGSWAIEDRWTGAYIFENEWQSFRTRQRRDIEMTSAPHTYAAAGRYMIAVKVIDIFGNDTMTLVPVTVG